MFRNSSKVSTSAASRLPPFLQTEVVAMDRILESSSLNLLTTLMGVVAPLGTRKDQLAVSDTHTGSEEDSKTNLKKDFTTIIIYHFKGYQLIII